MTFRLAHVGLGGWGRNWARNVIPTVEDAQVVAWVDASQDALEEAQEEFALPAKVCFSSLDEVLNRVDVDGVLVTATLPAHVPVAEAALKAGKHVLTEKPFAPSVGQAERLVELADSAGRVLMVSQNYRHFPAARTAADLVRSESAGRVYAVDLVFRRSALEPNPRHMKLVHPLLMDMSIHHFDLLRMVLGTEAISVYCHTWHPPGSRFQDPPAASAVIEFGAGVMVTYQGSWVSRGPQTPWAGEWRMETTQGEIRWTSRGDLGDRMNGERLRVRRMGDSKDEPVALADLAYTGRAGTLSTFIQAATTGSVSAYASTGRDNLGSLRLMAACIESAEMGQPVRL